MPTCKKCKNHFPNRIWVNGKEKYINKRSYCPDCSPIGSKNGYFLRKENTKFIHKDGHKICPICEKSKKWNKNNICSTCRTAFLRYKTKLRAIDFLGGKCVNCGIDDPDVLTFHHKNPEEKKFTLADWYGGKKWEILEKEVAKCCLLCCNCHAKHHKMENNTLKKVIDFYGRVMEWQTSGT